MNKKMTEEEREELITEYAFGILAELTKNCKEEERPFVARMAEVLITTRVVLVRWAWESNCWAPWQAAALLLWAENGEKPPEWVPDGLEKVLPPKGEMIQ